MQVKFMGRGIEFIEFCCASSCCMRHMFMVNCTNSGLGMPAMFPVIGFGVVVVCGAVGGGDAGADTGMLSFKETCALGGASAGAASRSRRSSVGGVHEFEFHASMQLCSRSAC